MQLIHNPRKLLLWLWLSLLLLLLFMTILSLTISFGPITYLMNLIIFLNSYVYATIKQELWFCKIKKNSMVNQVKLIGLS